ncbi:MAG: sterol desaturase family protein [Planctomycetaceae bacterium]
MPSELVHFLSTAKPWLTVLCFASFWIWETIQPFDASRSHRWRHAGRNVFVAILNTVILGTLFGAATVGVASWTAEREFGLLFRVNLAWPGRLLIAVFLLDAWLYVWHRLNHRIPVLWRFHRMHHSDHEMDVSTATRFHLGEHLLSAAMRLIIISVIGASISELAAYEILVVLATMFHHANISLGTMERWICWFIVTPGMHKIHHSRQRSEADSNYSVLFPLWDRIACTYHTQEKSVHLELGLHGFEGDRWQTVVGMLKTPFVKVDEEHAHRSDQGC